LAFWWLLTQAHRAGVGWKGYFTLPLGGLAVSALYIHAAYIVLSGSQVNWKGRHYRVNTSKTIRSNEADSSGRKKLEATAFSSESAD
jgi:hypothetical protein